VRVQRAREPAPPQLRENVRGEVEHARVH
jgi:hypothetical protein